MLGGVGRPAWQNLDRGAISAEPEDGQMCLVLDKLTLDSLIEALAPTIEDD
jgi:hypothetical protein